MTLGLMSGKWVGSDRYGFVIGYCFASLGNLNRKITLSWIGLG